MMMCVDSGITDDGGLEFAKMLLVNSTLTRLDLASKSFMCMCV